MKTIKYMLFVLALKSSICMMAIDYQLHQTSSGSFKSVSSTGLNSVNAEISNIHNTYNSVHPTKFINNDIPVIEFQSTSTMLTSGSTLPIAAITGTTTTTNTGNTPTKPKRIIGDDDEDDKPDNWEDPFDNPVGEIPFGFIGILLLLYLTRKQHNLCGRI